MKITSGEVTFERDDWTNGLARQVMGFMKLNGGKYNPERKIWSIGPKIESEIRTKFMANTPMQIHDDLEETFGNKMNGQVTVRGLLGLFKEVSELLDLIEFLESVSTKDEIMDMVNTEYRTKLDTFNELILSKESK